jgi:hypothetical protein
MTAPMYKNGVKMEVTDNPAGRAQLVKHGWSESEPVKKQPKVKKVVADDDSK